MSMINNQQKKSNKDSLPKFKNVGIMGFGNMGKAIFEILSRNSTFEFHTHLLPNQTKTKKPKGLVLHKNNQELIDNVDLLFVCIKPQDFKELPPIKVNDPHTIIISIMAGIKLEDIYTKFKTKKIIRTMPNLPLQVGRSVTGWHAKKNSFTTSELEIINDIIKTFGKSIPLKKEVLIDSLTAISGSGPAYFYLFLNALEKSAVNLGFSKKDSHEIALETIEGAIEYMKTQEKASPEDLIDRIASKGGTTEAALKKIQPAKFYSLWSAATQKAKERSKELSKK